MDESELFLTLGPNQILTILENAGFEPDGHIIALNSYENRVYRIGLFHEAPVVVKFYRPKRWTNEQILEEHRYTRELSKAEIPVIAPISDKGGQSLLESEQFRFSIYPCIGGRPPELDDSDHLKMIGRFLARIHLVGESELFEFRPEITLQDYVTDSSQYLLENRFLPAELEYTYQTIIEDLISRLESISETVGTYRRLRLHGDAHPGNILWYDEKPVILDFDDARNGPAIQDIWMFLSGDRAYMTARLNDILEGYTEFRHFDPTELALVEVLRTYRLIYFAAWIARRWDDPAFPLAFPHFNSQRYWEEHILSLREQAALLDEPPLQWLP